MHLVQAPRFLAGLAGDRARRDSPVRPGSRRRRAPAATARRETVRPSLPVRRGRPARSATGRRRTPCPRRSRGRSPDRSGRGRRSATAGSPPAETASGWPGSPCRRVYHAGPGSAWSRCRLISVVASPGTTVSIACAADRHPRCDPDRPGAGRGDHPARGLLGGQRRQPLVLLGRRDHRGGHQRVVQRGRVHALCRPFGFDHPADRRQRGLRCVVDREQRRRLAEHAPGRDVDDVPVAALAASRARCRGSAAAASSS